jgi:hypothetical protein
VQLGPQRLLLFEMSELALCKMTAPVAPPDAHGGAPLEIVALTHRTRARRHAPA